MSRWQSHPGGGTQLFFFQVRVLRPGFPKCGACELILASEKGGLRTDTCLWKGGLVNWKFLNLGACELKTFKFGGLRVNNLGENWGCRGYNFLIFSKGGLVNWLFWNGTLMNCRRGVKRGSLGPHIPIPSF